MAFGLTAVLDVSSSFFASRERKATFALISGNILLSIDIETYLDHDCCLASVRCRYDHVNGPGKTSFRDGVKLYLAGLSRFQLLDVRFRNICFNLEGAHIGNGNNG